MPVAAWMARCNAHYYATRDPFGVDGDFTTAPEISQMFGELIGAWFTDIWRRAGSPKNARLVELGPGRGTLMADMLRIMGAAKWVPPVDFIETSPVLRAAQAKRVPAATWHDDLATIPSGAPLFVIANEFFDALPIRQFVRVDTGWRERMVGVDGSGFVATLSQADATPLVPPSLWNAPAGSVVEVSPVSTALAGTVMERLGADTGAALIIDYGHAGPALGDTLQAVRSHAFADPFTSPGNADVTAHIDFTALARAGGMTAWGPVGQGDFLRALGIDARAAVLKSRATGAQSATIDAAVARLTGDEAMGKLFKVMALTSPGWPAPAGFA